MKRLASAIVPPIAFAIALGVLVHLARGTNVGSVMHGVRTVPPTRLGLALLLAAASYGILALVERSALASVPVRVPIGRTLLASFASSAVGHTLGFPVLTSNALRYRLYTGWGIRPSDVGRVVLFLAVTFWVGMLTSVAAVTLAGTALAAAALHVPPVELLLVGTTCLGLVTAHVAVAARSAPRQGVGALTTQRIGTAVAQAILPAIDWGISGCILYAALPMGRVPLTIVLGAYLLAQIAGMLSHVPAGLGVVEATMIALLAPWVRAPAVLVALTVYRLVYYAIPFLIACVLLGVHEAHARRETISRLGRRLTARPGGTVPAVLSLATFAGGAVLLVSGATPSIEARMELLHYVSPGFLIEGASFFASLIGVGLLLTSRGLYRRLDGAYTLTLALLAGGMVMSILKGLDYEEALYLGVVLAALVPARRFFPRRSTLTQLEFGRSWVVAISLVLGASAYLVFFSYRHVMFAEEVWWRVSLDAAASRSLRATVCAAVAAGVIGLIRMMRPVQPRLVPPDSAQLERAASIAAASPVASAHLALLGDKSLLFSKDGTAFLMYAICGRTWVAMGDPVGNPSACAELAWRFRELAAEHDARSVFYLVSPEHLPLYLDLGLSLLKLGESARIPLTSFTLEGGSRKWMRRARNAAIAAGCTFDVVPACAVAQLLPDLQRVSDAWLSSRRTREKGFSLGFFDEEYLTRLPVAVVRCHGEIVAFANLWPSGGREELSVDLMRYSPAAPPGVNDYLLCELMLWGKDAGYRQFDLGMAPLSGLDPRRLSPLWNRLGSLVYRRGEQFYHFQGLRRFKEKFDPEWEPRYLATPGPSTVPAALGGVTTLVSRGIAGAVRR